MNDFSKPTPCIQKRKKKKSLPCGDCVCCGNECFFVYQSGVLMGAGTGSIQNNEMLSRVNTSFLNLQGNVFKTFSIKLKRITLPQKKQIEKISCQNSNHTLFLMTDGSLMDMVTG